MHASRVEATRPRGYTPLEATPLRSYTPLGATTPLELHSVDCYNPSPQLSKVLLVEGLTPYPCHTPLPLPHPLTPATHPYPCHTPLPHTPGDLLVVAGLVKCLEVAAEGGGGGGGRGGGNKNKCMYLLYVEALSVSNAKAGAADPRQVRPSPNTHCGYTYYGRPAAGEPCSLCCVLCLLWLHSLWLHSLWLY